MERCQHFILYSEECGHRTAHIEHASKCKNKSDWFELPGIIRKPDLDKTRTKSSNKACKDINFTVKYVPQSCQACQDWDITTGSIPWALDPAEVEYRKQLHGMVQRPNGPEWRAEKREREWERDWADFKANYFAKENTTLVIVDPNSDVTPSGTVIPHRQLAIIRQKPENWVESDGAWCRICGIKYSEPSLFAKKDTPEYRQQAKRIRAMPCGHKFHSLCIKKWVNKYRKCPTCSKKWLWIKEPERPEFTDPIMQEPAVSREWLRLISGYVPFRDPTQKPPFAGYICSKKDAIALFGPLRGEMRPPAPPLPEDSDLVVTLIRNGHFDDIYPHMKDGCWDFYLAWEENERIQLEEAQRLRDEADA